MVRPAAGDAVAQLPATTTAGFVRYVCREVIRHGDTIGCAGLDGGPEGVLGTDCAVVWAGQAHGVPIGTGEHSTFSQIPAVVLGRICKRYSQSMIIRNGVWRGSWRGAW